MVAFSTPWVFRGPIFQTSQSDPQHGTSECLETIASVAYILKYMQDISETAWEGFSTSHKNKNIDEVLVLVVYTLQYMKNTSYSNQFSSMKKFRLCLNFTVQFT
jgi:hypothetical protein